ncbi:MAG: glycosyltransferase [Clostridiales bacterium]|nr:glycosyltransferase [Clostridiales bacterium]
MNINIIIPVLNEEKTIVQKVSEAIEFLENSLWKDNFRITIVDNGSTDKTEELSRELSTKFNLKVYYRQLSDKGVGLAFRTGILENVCDVIGYMDLDLATDLNHLNDVYKRLQDNNVDFVVGSRLLKDSTVIGRSFIRNITSWSLNFILKISLKVKFSDAMCGFKFYRKDVAKELVSLCSKNNGWFYCAEMMIRAEWKQYKLSEIPVHWTDDPNSKVKIGKLSKEYLKEICKLYKEKRINS